VAVELDGRGELLKQRWGSVDGPSDRSGGGTRRVGEGSEWGWSSAAGASRLEWRWGSAGWPRGLSGGGVRRQDEPFKRRWCWADGSGGLSGAGVRRTGRAAQPVMVLAAGPISSPCLLGQATAGHALSPPN
jgi:hypothetical protein